MLNGGLGNQLFQYIFARYIEKNSADNCIIDDSAFWGNNVEQIMKMHILICILCHCEIIVFRIGAALVY